MRYAFGVIVQRPSRPSKQSARRRGQPSTQRHRLQERRSAPLPGASWRPDRGPPGVTNRSTSSLNEAASGVPGVRCGEPSSTPIAPFKASRRHHRRSAIAHLHEIQNRHANRQRRGRESHRARSKMETRRGTAVRTNLIWQDKGCRATSRRIGRILTLRRIAVLRFSRVPDPPRAPPRRPRRSPPRLVSVGPPSPPPWLNGTDELTLDLGSARDRGPSRPTAGRRRWRRAGRSFSRSGRVTAGCSFCPAGPCNGASSRRPTPRRFWAAISRGKAPSARVSTARVRRRRARRCRPERDAPPAAGGGDCRLGKGIVSPEHGDRLDQAYRVAWWRRWSATSDAPGSRPPIDHHNTANAYVHLLLRSRNSRSQPLDIPPVRQGRPVRAQPGPLCQDE